MTQEKLREILDKHDKWIKGQKGGERADLSYVDLRDIDLTNTNLRGANLRGADLRGADLCHADLSGANLADADLRYANLTHANLASADLTKTNLANTDLANANLVCACLTFANLFRANLIQANLSDADLTGADLSSAGYTDTIINFQCPEEGSFIAWKKLWSGAIAKLLIPEDAERSSATTRKCRASKAVVLAIYDKDGEEISEDRSTRNHYFIYRVGETVYPDSWDEDRWNECSNGIHFFITRKEAEEY